MAGGISTDLSLTDIFNKGLHLMEQAERELTQGEMVVAQEYREQAEVFFSIWRENARGRI